MITKTCQVCGAEFTTIHHGCGTCRECSDRIERLIPEPPTGVCIVCGKPVKRKGTKTCGPKCALIRDRVNARVFSRNHKGKKREKKPKPKPIHRTSARKLDYVARQAKENGISYGVMRMRLLGYLRG